MPVCYKSFVQAMALNKMFVPGMQIGELVDRKRK